MEREDKYTAHPQERVEKNLQERIREAFNRLETDDGKELLAARAVFAGEIIEPEYVELALRRYEKQRYYDMSADEIKEKFAPFNLPKERQEQIVKNIKKYKEAYNEAEEEFRHYMDVERPEKDQAVLEKAKEGGYDIEKLESALRAEQEGNYELAYLIYINSPWKENDKKMKEVFHDFGFWSHVSRRFLLLSWARENKNQGIISVIRSRLDEQAQVWDKLRPTSRFHRENMVEEYETLGDYEEAARRAEGNPPSLSGVVNPEDVGDIPHELVQRIKELNELTLNMLLPIDEEELSKRVQAQRGRPNN